MRTGVIILPQQGHAGTARLWRRAEEYGFTHAWTYDHLAWRSLADEPWQATVPVLTVAALATSTIRIGTLVSSPNFRHPVPFAKELMSLDEVSEGRFTLGFGAGAPGHDQSVLGDEVPAPAERTARFREFVDLLDRLLTRPVTSFGGAYYRAVEARMIPGCVQKPRLPFVLAANGPVAVRHAARFAARHGDGWVTTGNWRPTDDHADWWRAVRETVDRFDAAGGPAGNRHLIIDPLGRFPVLASAQAFADAAGKAAELGFTDVVVHWPRASGVYAGDEAVLETLDLRA